MYLFLSHILTKIYRTMVCFFVPNTGRGGNWGDPIMGSSVNSAAADTESGFPAQSTCIASNRISNPCRYMSTSGPAPVYYI